MIRLDRRRALATVASALAAMGMGRRLEGAAPSRPVRGPIRLSLNENPFGPAPGVVEAITQDFHNLCRYTGGEFNALLNAIATHESVRREQVVLGEILEPLGTRLSLEGGPGGEFVYSDPGYTALIDTAAAVGGRSIAVPLNAALENDLAAIAAKVNERTRAVYLVNPHNPTGIVAAADAFRDFARSLSKRTLVIVDEAYLEYADDFAARTLQSAIKEKLVFDEDKKEMTYNLGNVLESMGKKDEAIEQYKLIYEVDSSYKDVAAKVEASYG